VPLLRMSEALLIRFVCLHDAHRDRFFLQHVCSVIFFVMTEICWVVKNRQSHSLVKPRVTFNKTTVDYTAKMEFLGIQIIDTLKWHSHIQLLASKLSKVAFMIKSLKEILSLNLIRNIYFAKFHSVLRFGILFWGEQAGGELTTRIFRIQKRVIRSKVGVSSRTSCR
jgi:uncharacterized protein YqgQ